jgi:hypothetical protein
MGFGDFGLTGFGERRLNTDWTDDTDQERATATADLCGMTKQKSEQSKSNGFG